VLLVALHTLVSFAKETYKRDDILQVRITRGASVALPGVQVCYLLHCIHWNIHIIIGTTLYTLALLNTQWCSYVYIGISTCKLASSFIHIFDICIILSTSILCVAYIGICTYTHIGISSYTLWVVRIYLHFWQCHSLRRAPLCYSSPT